MEKSLMDSIGLTERESKVYLALLKLGKTTTGPLSKESMIPSSKIYSTLNSLESKGLSNHILIGKTKYFSGEDPKKLLSIFKEKERNLESLIIDLEKKNAQKKAKSSVTLYEGMKAIKNLLIEKSENADGEIWLGLSNGENINDKKVADFYEWWGNQKINTKLKNINIISKHNEKIFRERYKKELKKMKKHFFFGKYFLPNDVAIIKDNIILLNLFENPTAILIKDEILSKHYTNFFNELLKDSKPI
jgi:sugar-specific transcriptional regulator TrmB